MSRFISPKQQLPQWVSARSTSGLLASYLDWVGEEGAHLETYARMVEGQNLLTTTPVGQDRFFWTVPYCPSPSEEIRVTYYGTTLSGSAKRAYTENEFTEATEPIFWVDPTGRGLQLRGLCMKQVALYSNSTTYSITGESAGLVPDADLWWRIDGERFWSRLAVDSNAVTGTSFTLPSSGDKFVRYSSASKLSDIASGTVKVVDARGTHPLLNLQLLTTKNSLDSWGDLLNIPRLPSENNITYKTRLLIENQLQLGNTTDGVVVGLGSHLGSLLVRQWDGVSTLTLDTTGSSGITNIQVVGQPRYKIINEILLPDPSSGNVYYSTYSSWVPGWSIVVDGVAISDVALATNKVVFSSTVTGNVVATYGVEQYTFTTNSSGYIQSLVPGYGIPSGVYLVALTRNIKVHTVELPEYQKAFLLTATKRPNKLFLDIAKQVSENNPTVFGRAKWGETAAWFDEDDIKPGVTYVTIPFDVTSKPASGS